MFCATLENDSELELIHRFDICVRFSHCVSDDHTALIYEFTSKARVDGRRNRRVPPEGWWH